MDRRYTQLENVVFLNFTDEQVDWQHAFAQTVQQERVHWRTLPERVERWRRERKLDTFYEEWALREP